MFFGALPKHSGKTYAWIDSSSDSVSGAYWLEDVDINGTRALHGPVTPEAATNPAAETIPAPAMLLNQLNQPQPAAASSEGSHPVESVLHEFKPAPTQTQKQFELAAHPGI